MSLPLMRAERMCELLRDGRSIRAQYRGVRQVTIKGSKYRVIECPGDGRCFYHAVAKAWQAKHLSADDVYGMVSRQYPEVRRVWAEDTDVTLTARALRLNIHVWEGVNRMWINFGEDDDADIWLFNPYNIHFDALVPLKT